MAKRVLNIVETAYRATLEEQDDPVLWLIAALKGAGAEASVLLRGNAVNYGALAQDASGLSFGDKKQTQPPRLASDLAALIKKGVDVSLVAEDALERGLLVADLIPGVQPIKRASLPKILERYEQVWHW